MSVKEQKPIVIFRGDNTAAFDLRTITILLTGDLDLTNATARFDLLGFTKSWTTEEVATGELSIVFDSAQTKAFALGPQMGTLRLFDMSTGTPRQLTVVNKIPFFVTNNVCEIDSQSYGVNVSVTSGETIHIEFNVGLDAVEGKADKVEGATAGDLASLTEDGNLEDSGIPKTDVQRKLTFDTTPTEGSLNPVTSDGIKRALDAATPEDYDQVKAQVEQNTSDIGTNTENIRRNTEDISTNAGNIETNTGDIADIKEVIPNQASAQNQLADKNFVNSSIATNTATFRGSYNLVSDLGLTVSATEQQVAAAIAAKLASLAPPVVPENNDYCFVQVPKTDADPTVIERVDRYKCTVTESGGVTTRVWEYEWSLNNSSFTADQWAAINSGITSGAVEKLAGIEAGAQVNAIETIKVNGTALVPDANKAVDVTVPAIPTPVAPSAATENGQYADAKKTYDNIGAKAFDSTKAYAVGDRVIYDNKLYECLTAGTGNWNASRFRLLLRIDGNVTVGSGAAIRTNTLTTPNHNVAIGETAIAGQTGNVAIGYHAQAKAVDNSGSATGKDMSLGNVAIGQLASADNKTGPASAGEWSPQGDVAIGYGAEAHGQFSVVIGAGSDALGNRHTAIGKEALASGEATTVIGPGATTNPDFVDTKAYAVGDIVKSGSNIYRCKSAVGAATEGEPNPIPPLDKTHWEGFSTYSENITYSYGQIVKYSGIICQYWAAQPTSGNVPSTDGDTSYWRHVVAFDNTAHYGLYTAVLQGNYIYRCSSATSATTLDNPNPNPSDDADHWYMLFPVSLSTDNSLAIGNEARITAEDAIAIGNGARATEDNSVVIGAGAKSHGANTTNFKTDELSKVFLGTSNIVDLINAAVNAAIANTTIPAAVSTTTATGGGRRLLAATAPDSTTKTEVTPADIGALGNSGNQTISQGKLIVQVDTTQIPPVQSGIELKTITQVGTSYTRYRDGDIVLSDGISSYTINLPNTSGTLALVSQLANYLPLTGGTMTGQLTLRDRLLLRDASFNSAKGLEITRLDTEYAGGWRIYEDADYGLTMVLGGQWNYVTFRRRAADSTSDTVVYLHDLAPEYSTSKTYEAGSLVVRTESVVGVDNEYYYKATLYRCTTAIETAEAWTAAHWTEATVEDVLAAIRSALDLKAPLASPAFTGTPTAPNLTNQSADGQIANKKYVDDKVAGVSVTPLSGQTFDFATMQGVFDALKAAIEALGGTVTNAPTTTSQGE